MHLRRLQTEMSTLAYPLTGHINNVHLFYLFFFFWQAAGFSASSLPMSGSNSNTETVSGSHSNSRPVNPPAATRQLNSATRSANPPPSGRLTGTGRASPFTSMPTTGRRSLSSGNVHGSVPTSIGGHSSLPTGASSSGGHHPTNLPGTGRLSASRTPTPTPQGMKFNTASMPCINFLHVDLSSVVNLQQQTLNKMATVEARVAKIESLVAKSTAELKKMVEDLQRKSFCFKDSEYEVKFTASNIVNVYHY